MARPVVEKKKLYVLPRFDKRRGLSSGICNTIDLYGWTDDKKKFFLGSLRAGKLNHNSMHCWSGKSKPDVLATSYTDLVDQNLYYTIENFLSFFDLYTGTGYVFDEREDHYKKEVKEDFTKVYEKYKEDIAQCIEEYNQKVRENFACFIPKILEISSIYLMQFFKEKQEKFVLSEDITSPKESLKNECWSLRLEKLEHVINAMSLHMQDLLKKESCYQTKVTNPKEYQHYVHEEMDSVYLKLNYLNRPKKKKNVQPAQQTQQEESLFDEDQSAEAQRIGTND